MRVPVLFHRGVQEGRISLNRFVELISTNPAKIMGLYPRKGAHRGRQRRGHRRHRPDAHAGRCAGEDHHMSADYNCWEGWELKGKVSTTILRGSVLVENEQLGRLEGRRASSCHGRCCPRSRATPRISRRPSRVERSGRRERTERVAPRCTSPIASRSSRSGPATGSRACRTPYPLDVKLELIELLAEAGLPKIEVTALSARTSIPQLADAEDVLAGSAGRGLRLPRARPEPPRGRARRRRRRRRDARADHRERDLQPEELEHDRRGEPRRDRARSPRSRGRRSAPRRRDRDRHVLSLRGRGAGGARALA